jgi:hypothetical protein
MSLNKQEVVPLSGDPAELLEEVYDLQEAIRGGTQRINDLEQRRASIMEELRFHGITEAGDFFILNDVRTSRKINVKRFREAFPSEFDTIVAAKIRRLTKEAGKSITVAEAEAVLTPDELSPLCDLNTTVKERVEIIPGRRD